jgi:hypothetical protein|tara:strand:+ start:343 stop:549 length:207 start_codon:yes stop_codon:yes gene_type:complete
MAHSIETLRKYNKPAMKKLIMAVKMSHMKDLPKEAITDREAERVLESLNALTLERLYKLAVEHDIVNL